MVVAACVVGEANAAMMIQGGLTFDPATSTGYTVPNTSWFDDVNNVGVAVRIAQYEQPGQAARNTAMLWSVGGNRQTLPSLPAPVIAVTGARAINYAGLVVGSSVKYVGAAAKGARAVKWTANGTAVTELGGLGVFSDGVSSGAALYINYSGLIAGSVIKVQTNQLKGERAVRWNPNTTVAIELGNLGTDATGFTNTTAYDLNESGMVVGSAPRYVGGVMMGNRAVRWAGTSTDPVELDYLGTDPSGSASTTATDVNNLGAIAGHGSKYVNGIDKGARPIRWNAGGTAATELGILGTNADGISYSFANLIDDQGTTAGYVELYTNNAIRGSRAVRWAANSTTPTVLGHLGTDSFGSTSTYPSAMNSRGTIVGFASIYAANGTYTGRHAVAWLADTTVAIDLNALGLLNGDGAGTWVLEHALSMSENGYVSGYGMFDVDGPDPSVPYRRAFVTQLGFGGNWLGGSGTWVSGANWSTGTPAMSLGSATFEQAATYTVTLDRDESTQSVAIRNGVVTLNSNAFTLTTTGGVIVASNSTLKGNARFVGNLTSNGRLSPGDLAGGIHVTGNLASWGTLDLELAGAAAFDSLTVSGSAQFAGSLVVRTLNGFSPPYGSRFRVISAGSRSGSFAYFDKRLTSTKYMIPVYAPTYLELLIANLGDATLDGNVAFDDLLVLAQNYGHSGRIWTTGDFNGDALVDFADLLSLAQNYSAGSQRFESDWMLVQSLVPEPTVLATTLLCASRRRRVV